MQTRAWRLPETIRGYPLPRGGQFAHSKTMLDPAIFDSRNEMHPWIRDSLVNILDAFWTPRYGPGWRSWTRLYLAGSLASYWWGTPDFDTLIGVDLPLLSRIHPDFEGRSSGDICKALTQEFYVGLDPLTAHLTFPPAGDVPAVVQQLRSPNPLLSYVDDSDDYETPRDLEPLGPVEVTWYVNPNSWDIRRIHPYAAYEVIKGQWWVYPATMGKRWGPEELPWSFWQRTADVADQIKAVLAIPDPDERQARSKEIYDQLHEARRSAFSAGYGLGEVGEMQWVVLNRWGLLGPLEASVDPIKGMSHLLPSVASSSHPLGYSDLPEPARNAIDHYMNEGNPGTRRHHSWHYRLDRVPTEEMKRRFMANPDIASGYDTFDDYHRGYLSGGVEHHPSTNRWPVLTPGFDGEAVEDGNHRFHDYVRSGFSTIPALDVQEWHRDPKTSRFVTRQDCVDAWRGSEPEYRERIRGLFERAFGVSIDDDLEVQLLPTHYVPLRGHDQSVQRTATSWRAMHPEHEQVWREHDAVIVPEHGATGTKRTYTTYTYGQPIATRHSLEEAKAAIHEVYGMQPWEKKSLPRLTTVHRSLGPTEEFSDPRHVWVVKELPFLS